MLVCGVGSQACWLARVAVACASIFPRPTVVAYLFVPWLNMMTGICYTAGDELRVR